MRYRAWMALALALSLVACGSGDGGSTFPPPAAGPAPATPDMPFASLGELEDAIDEANNSPNPADRADADADSLPDVIELQLETDPLLADTDRDGLVDGFELFGESFDRSDPLPDRDRDGLVSPRDVDDDGDRRNDGLDVDTDGDQVANYLEYYGYTYDILTGRFELWNGDPDVPHYFTDPLQPSTDQDAYPDGMEASGALLDPTVGIPGDDPLVPAAPNVIVRLMGYTVTLNEDIEVQEGESLARGREWSREMEISHAYTDERSWEVGAELGFSAKSDSQGVEGKVSTTTGGTQSSTHSTSTTVASGESVTSERNWSTARSANPTDAAHLKLFLQVENAGTAPISNVVPTLTIKIGGLSIATFEPGGDSIAMLVPGGVYPEAGGGNWVVDSLAGGQPLSVTMSELRALENGAPVSISLAQVRGDVMQLGAGGVWESIGDTNQYVARCDSVCASLRIELEDGIEIRHLVYGDDEPSSPQMTLGEALVRLGVDEEGTLVYFDANGTPHERSLSGFTFAVDPDTLRANGWTLALDGAPETSAPEGTHLSDLRLRPYTRIMIRAPRDPVEQGGPEVHYASLDAYTGEVKVSAADYRGVTTVQVVDGDGVVVLDLHEELAGTGFYSGLVGDENAEAFDGSSELRAVVTNLDGQATGRDLGKLYEPPEPVAPLMPTLTLDQATHVLYAQVQSGKPEQANSDVAWVRVFHDKLPDGVLDLETVVNYYEDPDGVSADLGFELLKNDPPLEVVAYVGPGVYTVRVLGYDDPGVDNITVFRRTQASLAANTQAIPQSPVLWWYRYERALLDMDSATAAGVVTTDNKTRLNWGEPDPPGSGYDLWIRVEGASSGAGAVVDFNMFYARLDGADYRALTKSQVVAASPASQDPLDVEEPGGLRVGQVYALRTTDGRYGKMKVLSIEWDYSFWTSTRSVTVTLDNVAWD